MSDSVQSSLYQLISSYVILVLLYTCK